MNAGQAAGDSKALVLQAIDIVQLIGQTVNLKKRGKDYVGLCPFHQEKTPSFHVSPGKQFFHCYGCKAGGNAIDFVIKRDRVEFREALEILARAAGIELPRFGGQKQNTGERQMLLDAQSAACALFEKLLAHEQIGHAAREYLASRGFNDDSIKRFQIGYAPDGWDNLLRHPSMKKFAPGILQIGGLIKARESGSGHYDTFRNRLMFPIRDETGRVIAFGGRAMPGSQDPAKYLNSPETPLFSKSRSIFGLDLARQKIVETRMAAVVEGYTDVVMAHQYGAGNVVSILGTAMTEQHVQVLRRFADRIVLLFDADSAGDLAVNRAVELFLTQPIEIAIASMPEGVDPDEFLLQHGADAFAKVLTQASDALTYKWKQLSREFQKTGDLTAQQKAVQQYLDLLSSARGTGPVDPIRWGGVLSRVSRLTEIPMEELHRRFKTTRPAPRRTNAEAEAPVKPAGPPRPLTARDRAERWILGILLNEPQRWHDVQQHMHVQDFSDDARRRLADTYWLHQRDEGEPVFNQFLAVLDAELTELAVSLLQEAEALAEVDQSLREALLFIEQSRRGEEERKLIAELRRTSDEKPDEAEEILLLKKLQEQARQPDLRRVV